MPITCRHSHGSLVLPSAPQTINTLALVVIWGNAKGLDIRLERISD